MKILFILKSGDSYSGGYRQPGGLYNSARFVVDMLNATGVSAALEQVIDNNDIDRVVSEHRPDIVVIEALWVVPEKFDVLQKLHPNVRWVVRLHSELPFLALEGIAFDWLAGYQVRGVSIATNSRQLFGALAHLFPLEDTDEPIYYLPNYYPTPSKLPRHSVIADKYLLIGCFGAMRPLKNHLLQAVAAISYAERAGKKLRFFVNTNNADPQILKNVRALFVGRNAVLNEMGWYAHADFLSAINDMDVSMQCSLSETFNIVTADAVSRGVPVVVSPEIGWTSRLSQVNPTDVKSVERGLARALRWPKALPAVNLRALRRTSAHAQKAWLQFAN